MQVVPITQRVGTSMPAGAYEDFQTGTSLGSMMLRLLGTGLTNLSDKQREQMRLDRAQANVDADNARADKALAQNDRQFSATLEEKKNASENDLGYEDPQTHEWVPIGRTTVPDVRAAGAALGRGAGAGAEVSSRSAPGGYSTEPKGFTSFESWAADNCPG